MELFRIFYISSQHFPSSIFPSIPVSSADELS